MAVVSLMNQSRYRRPVSRPDRINDTEGDLWLFQSQDSAKGAPRATLDEDDDSDGYVHF
jgi:hypothetical protein